MTEEYRHTCARPGCTKELQFGVYACGKHWFELPLPLRSAIVSAWGQLRPYLRGQRPPDLEKMGEAMRRYEAAQTAAEVWWSEHASPGQLAAQAQLVAQMGLKVEAPE